MAVEVDQVAAEAGLQLKGLAADVTGRSVDGDDPDLLAGFQVVGGTLLEFFLEAAGALPFSEVGLAGATSNGVEVFR